MALIAYPTLNAPYNSFTRLDLEPWNPNQEEQENPYTGDVAVYARSPGRWRGVATIGEMNDREQAGLVEAWVAGLRGAANWSNIPLDRPTLAEDVSLSITAVDTATGVLTVAEDLTALAVTIGLYCRIGTRVLIIEGIPSQHEVVVWPFVPALSVGAALLPATTIQVRRPANRGVALPREVDIFGPWVIDFVEKI